jgi:hypothetical protein
MPNVIRETESGLKIGLLGLGFHGNSIGTVKNQVSDGDTISAHPMATDDLPIRFLGVDAPETRFRLPGQTAFKALDHADWQAFLADPLNEAKYGNFNPPMTQALRAHLSVGIGAMAATNHRKHALAAKVALAVEVENDLTALGQTKENFGFFLAFAYDVMDGYGRLLCYINRDQPDDDEPSPRPHFYQERLLKTGHVVPFFMWPNVDPFLTQQLAAGSIVAAVFAPGTQNQLENQGKANLKLARDNVKHARANKLGVFEAADPLRLMPGEVRFLSSRHPPRRWVIDLSKSDNLLIHPQNYFTIPHYEDRLFIPEEFVPLFVDLGWQRQAPPP